MWKSERCELCDGQGTRAALGELQLVDDRELPDVDPLDAALDRRDETSDLGVLERALEAMPKRLRGLVVGVFVTATIDRAKLSPGSEHRLELGLAWLLERMPDPIRLPAGLRANMHELERRRTRAKGRQAGNGALKKRDEEIRRLAQKGHGVQWIAAEYGLSTRLVYEVLRRASA